MTNSRSANSIAVMKIMTQRILALRVYPIHFIMTQCLFTVKTHSRVHLPSRLLFLLVQGLFRHNHFRNKFYLESMF